MEIKEYMEKGAGVDVHLADQLLIYMAMYGGEISTTEISSHAKTAMALLEMLEDVSFEVGKSGELYRVMVEKS
jgi:RNA 3'-terminal phosphate cyclase (ATP)